MIATMPPTNVNNQSLTRVLEVAEKLLYHKLFRALNPNVIDSVLKLTILIQDGHVNHIRDYDSEPSYVSGLPMRNNDESQARSVLAVIKQTLEMRLQPRMVRGWHGSVGLSIAICNGEATITSEADGVHKP